VISAISLLRQQTLSDPRCRPAHAVGYCDAGYPSLVATEALLNVFQELLECLLRHTFRTLPSRRWSSSCAVSGMGDCWNVSRSVLPVVIAVVRELFLTHGALPLLLANFPIQQLSNLCRRSEFPVRSPQDQPSQPAALPLRSRGTGSNLVFNSGARAYCFAIAKSY
jgi:hypothetical protein